MKKNPARMWSWLIILALLIVFITGWWMLAHYRIVNRYLLPAPGTVWMTALELIASGELLQHLFISTQRILSGYLIAIGLSALLVLLLQTHAAMKLLLQPLINFIRQIPPLSLIPLLLIWVGIGEAQKVTIIVLGCIFPIFFGFLSGVQQTDKKLLEVARLLQLSRWKTLQRIYLPSALPAVMTGLQVGLGFAWRSLVGAELVASSSGLGYLILDAENLSRSDIVIVGILTIGLCGVITDNLLNKLMDWLSPWMKYHKALSSDLPGK